MGKTKQRKDARSSGGRKGGSDQDDLDGAGSRSNSEVRVAAAPGRVVQSGLVDLDPELVYFTHSKIRPFFSGCGKKIEETINEIKSGVITVDHLPTITVLSAGNGYFFSLNNRRLYVMKYLRENGYLADRSPANTVKVRIKAPLPREMLKYTPDKCSLKCKIMKERAVVVSSATISGRAESSGEEEGEEEESPFEEGEEDSETEGAGKGGHTAPSGSAAKGLGVPEDELQGGDADENSDRDDEVPYTATSSRMQALYVSDSSSSSEDN